MSTIYKLKAELKKIGVWKEFLIAVRNERARIPNEPCILVNKKFKCMETIIMNIAWGPNNYLLTSHPTYKTWAAVYQYLRLK